MSLKESILKAAAAGLALGAANSQALANDSSKKADAAHDMIKPGTAQCFGVNSCKGTNACALSEEHIKAANAAFKNKFAKTKAHGCGGMVGGHAKEGHLGWVTVPTEAECLKKDGGFVFVKDKSGKLVVKDATGVKKG